MDLKINQKLTYQGKPYKVSKVEGDFVTLKCLVCAGKTVRLKKDQL